MNIQPEIASRIEKLEEKFKLSGQDLASYLDGLLYDKYLTYWDYIKLDTLLSLQLPKTHFPDEMIFVTYHQITELHFKLIIHEQKQIIEKEDLKADFFTERLARINRYFRILTDSFDVMIKGMDRAQFQQFRMSLLPASGFQSAQFRMIEIYSAPLQNLVHNTVSKEFSKSEDIAALLENLYWKRGATDLSTGEKTLTLRQFEEEYAETFFDLANSLKNNTLYDKYLQLPKEEQDNKKLVEALRTLDTNANVNWPLMHMGAAMRYLHREKETIAATGGTNWKEFLPPSFQKISFFPNLWSKEELDNWGKEWVTHIFNTEKKQ